MMNLGTVPLLLFLAACVAFVGAMPVLLGAPLWVGWIFAMAFAAWLTRAARRGR